MDLAASAGFVAEPKEKNIYTRPPRNPKENIMNNRTIADILIKGIFLFAGVIGVYLYAMSHQFSTVEAQTFAFAAWIFGHIALAFVSRSDREFVVSLGLFSNKVMDIWAALVIGFLIMGIYIPGLSTYFNFARISVTQLLLIALTMIILIGILELRKLFHPSEKREPAYNG